MPTDQQFNSEPDAIRAGLKAYRKRHSLSQSRVCTKLGISQARLSAFETGKNHSLRSDKLELLRKILAMETSREADVEQENILPFGSAGIASDDNPNAKPKGISVDLRAEMNAQILQNLEVDAVSVALIDGMSDKELFRAYLMSKQLDG